MVSLEQQFERFRRRGDVAALGVVFDAVAAELLVVAAHVARAGVEAEDVLQSTFLEVIRHADRWDGARPLRPWLLGILFRVASDARKRAARVPDRERVEVAGAVARSPLDEAAGRELADRVSAALAALPVPYRQVLVLRLVHGLKPTQIAHALGCPVATVKTRLQRGMARLRALLPAGLAASLALLVVGRGLAQVRAVVLERARPRLVAATGAAAMVSGGLLMKKVLLGVLAAGVVLVAWMAWPRGVAAVAPRRDAAAPPATMAASTAPRPQDRGGTDEAPLAREVVGAGAEPLVSDEERVTVVGRMVAAENGAPLAGVTITLPVRGDDDAASEGRVSAPFVTGADGRYRVWFDADASTAFGRRLAAKLESIHFVANAPGRARLITDLTELRPGVALDQGDVAMPSAVTLRIRVVDEHGLPAPEMALFLLPKLTAEQAKARRRWAPEARPPRGPWASDAHGRLPDVLVAPGTYVVQHTDGPLWRMPHDHVFEVPAGVATHEVTIPVEPPDFEHAIAGTVCDAAGRPLAGVGLCVVANGVLWPGTSTASGRFVIQGVPAGAHVVELADHDAVWSIERPVGSVETGTRDLAVVLRRVADGMLRLRVVRADGRPVRRFAWSCWPARDVDRPDESVTLLRNADLEVLGACEPHEGGVAERTVRPGRALVCVRAADDELAPALCCEIVVPESGARTETVVLEPWTTWTARVVDRQQRPIEGADVRVLQRAGHGSPLEPEAVDVEAALSGRTCLLSLSLVLASAVTDASGTVTLRTPTRVGNAVLVASSPTHPVGSLAIGPEAPAGAVTLHLENAAVVEGRLEPVRVVAALGPSPRLRAEAARTLNPEKLLESWRSQIRLARVGSEDARVLEAVVHDDGTFVVPQVPPGRWAVRMMAVGGDFVHRELGTLDLAAGERRTVTFDLGALVPHRVHGRVTLDGLPVADAAVALLGEELSTATHVRDGRYEVETVLSGQVVPRLMFVGGAKEYRSYVEAPIEVPAGEDPILDLAFVRRGLRLRVVDAEGVPVAGREVVLRPLDGARVSPAALGTPRTTDANGVVRFEGLPPYVLEAWLQDGSGEDGATAIGEVSEHLGNVETETALRLRSR